MAIKQSKQEAEFIFENGRAYGDFHLFEHGFNKHLSFWWGVGFLNCGPEVLNSTGPHEHVAVTLKDMREGRAIMIKSVSVAHATDAAAPCLSIALVGESPLVAVKPPKYTVQESSVVKRTVTGDVVRWDYVNPLVDSDVPEALTYIKTHADYTSYLLLMTLRKHYPAAYKTVSNEDKSAILCSALRNTMSLNDWGVFTPSTSFDDQSAKALLETGEEALKCLAPILDDDSPALLFGSQEALTSEVYGYRRKDFAYRYASLILGKSPAFRADPKERDKDIEKLKTELTKRVPGK